MSTQEDIESMMRELRRFREEIPGVANALSKQQVCGKGARGSVRAYCDVSGSVSRVEIDTYFLSGARSCRVDAALLEALQNAESTAAQKVSDQQEKLQFMGMPIGEVISGKRSFADMLRFSDDTAKSSREGR